MMSLSRRQVLGLLFLPLVAHSPTQYGGAVTYHCDLGEAAYGLWYMPQAGLLGIDWHLRNWETGQIEVDRNQVPAPGRGFIRYWAEPPIHKSVLRVVWYSIWPAVFEFGTCVL